MEAGEDFGKALTDYHYLLEKGYDSAGARDFVGNRYQLSGEERSMLFRGVFGIAESKARSKRLRSSDAIEGDDLHIDAANVIYTITNYLQGRKVFIATDGLLRDAAEIHSGMSGKNSLERAGKLVIETLGSMHARSLNFYLEEKMPASLLIRQLIERTGKDLSVKPEYEFFAKPDKVLASMQTGILSTADSALIDRSSLPVFDLAGHVIIKNFSPDLLDLSYLNA